MTDSTSKFFVDSAGNYLGEFDGVEPPDGAIEIQHPPPHGKMLLVDGVWVMPPEAPPAIVTMRQARQALYDAGMLANVEAALAGMSGTDGDKARIDWATATTVERENTLVVSLAAALSLTEAQLDALFVSAAGF